MKQQLIVSTLTLADFLQRHPRQIAAAVAAVLMGSTGAAYAVASLGAGAASKSAVHLVTEAAALPSLQAQAQALEGYDLTLYRSARTRATDTAHSLLERLGMTDPDAAQFLRRNTLARKELLGHIGRQVRAEAGADGRGARRHAGWPGAIAADPPLSGPGGGRYYENQARTTSGCIPGSQESGNLQGCRRVRAGAEIPGPHHSGRGSAVALPSQ